MIEFTTLGTVDLRRDGEEVRSVLLQPKRLAVLAYLVTASPRGFHSRDTVLGLFWPDADQERARNAMRQALHFLRRTLGEEVLAGRGDRDVGIASGTIRCDAAAFDDALSAGRLEEAVGLYRGDFLRGLFVEEAPEAERWLEAERDRRRQAVQDALRTLADREAARSEWRAALLWARQAVALAPTDEGAVRRLIGTLDRSGEPAAALDAYDQLVHRLREEFGVPPSADTIRLVNQIRSRPAATLAPAVTAREAPSSVPTAPSPEVIAASTPMPASPASAPSPAAGRRQRPILLGAAVALAALVAGGIALRSRTPPSPVRETTAIAVLPFANMSGDPANDYLSDGFTEEVLNALANIDGLQVAARTSSFRFKGVDAPVDSIARALQVRHLLEGSVRRDGDRIRVTAQLIDAPSGFHLWSETYDRTLGDLFAVQDEISRGIAQRLRHIQLDGDGTPETRDAQAHQLFLQARLLGRLGTNDDSVHALLGQAIRRDPSYARAHAYLALSRLYDVRHTSDTTMYALARAGAERALALREVPEAHMVLGRLADVGEWDFAAADRHYAQAIELSPSSSGAYTQRARLLLRLGRPDEALAVARRSVELDPLNPASHNALGGVLAMVGRPADAVPSYRAALALVPDHPSFLANLAAAQADAGDIAAATATVDGARAAGASSPYLQAIAAYVLARAGRGDSARRLLSTLERDPSISPVVLASAWTVLGNHDHALDLLERAAETRDTYLTDLMATPEFAPLRDEPRFRALAMRLGLAGGDTTSS